MSQKKWQTAWSPDPAADKVSDEGLFEVSRRKKAKHDVVLINPGSYAFEFTRGPNYRPPCGCAPCFVFFDSVLVDIRVERVSADATNRINDIRERRRSSANSVSAKQSRVRATAEDEDQHTFQARFKCRAAKDMHETCVFELGPEDVPARVSLKLSTRSRTAKYEVKGVLYRAEANMDSEEKIQTKELLDSVPTPKLSKLDSYRNSASLRLDYVPKVDDERPGFREDQVSAWTVTRWNDVLAPLKASGSSFVEAAGAGRDVVLRGVNLSGQVKQPFGWATQNETDWAQELDRKDLTFVGRPFPLSEADEHLGRISAWGFNCLRFLVTWEAIEHQGPGVIDVEYLDYVEKVVELAGSYGLYCVMDPHQDVWSRCTGGSGAPLWTLTKGNLDLSKIHSSKAAFTHATATDDPRKFTRMSWPQNYQRFACLHMFALFFGGSEYCPDFVVENDLFDLQTGLRAYGDGEDFDKNEPPEDFLKGREQDSKINIQLYLQGHFVRALTRLFNRVSKFSHVIGVDTFNEPSAGFIGLDLDKPPEVVIPPGEVYKPFQAMTSAAGFATKISTANGAGMLTGSKTVNQEGISVWLDPEYDVWRKAGVWEVNSKNEPVLLRPDHFNYTRGQWDDPLNNENLKQIDPSHNLRAHQSVSSPHLGGGERRIVSFFRDHLRPFMRRFGTEVRKLDPHAVLFLEGDNFGVKEFFWSPERDLKNVANATHWYDGFLLFTRRYFANFNMDVEELNPRPVFGSKNIAKMHLKNVTAVTLRPRDPFKRNNASYLVKERFEHFSSSLKVHRPSMSVSDSADVQARLAMHMNSNRASSRIVLPPSKSVEVNKKTEDVSKKKRIVAVAAGRNSKALKPVKMPSLIGEFGIPYDLNNKQGYKLNGSFLDHTSALASYYSVFDKIDASSTQWNYASCNSNEFGDDWNLEDLSIFSYDQQTDKSNIHSGGRAVLGFSRPFAPKVNGTRSKSLFDSKKRTYTLRYFPATSNFKRGSAVDATEIVLPDVQFLTKDAPEAPSFTVHVAKGAFRMTQRAERHVVRVWAEKSGQSFGLAVEAVTVTVKLSSKSKPLTSLEVLDSVQRKISAATPKKSTEETPQEEELSAV